MIRSVLTGLGRAGRSHGTAADVWRRRAEAVPEPDVIAPPRHADDGLEPFLAHVRPPGWTQPTAHGRYDLLVVGAGSVGIAAAQRARAAGARVALAADDPLGLDLLADALPRQILLRVAAQAHEIRHAAAGAWPEARIGRLDFAAVGRELFAARQAAAARLAAEQLTRSGIDVFLGPLAFIGPAQLKVAGQTLRFRRALLDPVPRTVIPQVDGLEQLGYRTPETLGMLTGLPHRWAIVGGTPAACELAQAFCRLGSAVDLVLPGSRLLPDEDPAVSQLLEQQFAADGIRLHAGSTCVLAQRTGAAKSLVIEQAGHRKKLLADDILIAGERGCEVGWLRPGLAGVTLAPTHDAARPAAVPVSASLQTSNRHILSVGPQLADDASDRQRVAALAQLVVDNSLGWRPRPVDRLTTPRRIHTAPAIYRLGPLPTTSTGEDQRAETSSHVFQLPAECAAPGLLVLRVDQRRRRVVGATVAGGSARELVAPLEALLREQHELRLFRMLRSTVCQSGSTGELADVRLTAWLREQLAAALA